jgi:hypothetical protein
MQVLMHLVSALMDINPSMTTHMPLHLWKRCVSTLFQVLSILKNNPHITIDENHDEGEERRTGELLLPLHASHCMTSRGRLATVETSYS